MKPLIIEIFFYAADNLVDAKETLQRWRTVIFSDGTQAEIMEAFRKFRGQHDVPEIVEIQEEEGVMVVYGENPDEEIFCALVVDPIARPHAFQQALQDLQHDVNTNLEAEFLPWAKAYPAEAACFLNGLDTAVGREFVDDIWALKSLRSIAYAWNERIALTGSINSSSRPSIPKSL